MALVISKLFVAFRFSRLLNFRNNHIEIFQQTLALDEDFAHK